MTITESENNASVNQFGLKEDSCNMQRSLNVFWDKSRVLLVLLFYLTRKKTSLHWRDHKQTIFSLIGWEDAILAPIGWRNACKFR